jgi:bacillithiol biosynthesis deacetylase BshB1
MPDVDVMAFGPHPDDIELGCGGTLIKLSDLGYSTVLVDMTRGEMGTRGTAETRRAEAAAAAEILGATARENLALEDSNIAVTPEAKRKVVEIVRKYRPKLVLIPYYEDRHPDHYHASALAYEGLFLAGLSRYETGQKRYRPSRVMYYARWYGFAPSFVVDVSAQYDRKMQAIMAYATQFKADDASYEQTRLTTREYHWQLMHEMAYYGSLIQVQYGEPYLVRGNIEVENPLDVRFSTF